MHKEPEKPRLFVLFYDLTLYSECAARGREAFFLRGPRPLKRQGKQVHVRIVGQLDRLDLPWSHPARSDLHKNREPDRF